MASSTRKKSKPEEPAERLPSQMGPLVFISHDSRDAELAEAFSKLLSSVSAGVLKSFRSSDRKGSQGIEYGTEWYPELMKRLSTASDVVCLLTQRSVERPWILYEAGVAKGKLGTLVFGIALGIPLSRAATGPFAQFQNCEAKEDDLTKLVMQLVDRIPNSEPDREAIAMQVRSFLEKVKSALDKLDERSDKEPQPAIDETSVAKLFEEVKVMFQDLPSRIESLDPFHHRKRGRLHPMLIQEILAESNLDDPTALLVVLGILRNDFPWLYEIGVEAHRAIIGGNPAQVGKAGESLQRALELMFHGPISREFHDEETYFAVRRSMDILDRLLTSALERLRKKPGRAKRPPKE